MPKSPDKQNHRENVDRKSSYSLKFRLAVAFILGLAVGGVAMKLVSHADKPKRDKTTEIIPYPSAGQKDSSDGNPVLPVMWKNPKGKMVKVRGEDLILNLVTKKPMPHINWIFSGSKIIEGQFAAQVERSIIATYHDPMAIIDHPLPTGADDTVYGVNQALVPKVRTEITMTIKAVEKKEKKKTIQGG